MRYDMAKANLDRKPPTPWPVDDHGQSYWRIVTTRATTVPSAPRI
jgi:hypothetical protein